MSAEMTDRELLELAAKAAGYEVQGDQHPSDGLNVAMNGRVWVWRPLDDDGDALRLAVKLHIQILTRLGYSSAETDRISDDVLKRSSAAVSELILDDEFETPYAATRRAIVRAAAEIGRAMG